MDNDLNVLVCLVNKLIGIRMANEAEIAAAQQAIENLQKKLKKDDT